jgi:hypothetical protein
MSRETRLNRTVRRTLDRRLRDRDMDPKAPRLRRRIAGILAFAIGIPGIVAALLSLFPRVSVAVSAPVDPDNAMSALATVTNTGFIPLDSVELWVGIGNFCTQKAPCSAPAFPSPMRDYRSRMKRRQWLSHPRMEVDEQFTFPLDDIMRAEDPGGLVYADLAIIVVYKVPYIHIVQEKTFPLYTRKATSGKLYWQWK